MSEKNKVYCIAEVGSNFNNNLKLAKQYVYACAEAGADAIKFQTLLKKKIISPVTKIDNEIVPYPIYDIFNSAELPEKWHYELKKEADIAGIEFMSTPFHIEAVDLLVDINVKKIKIASGDITFFPLLEKIGRTGKDVILSTGASTDKDIEVAINFLRKYGSNKINLLHCVANYPPKWHEMNISAIPEMKKKFGLNVGISDHSPGSVVPIASVALGANIIEKHVTFDKHLKGPDHGFAMTISEYAEMVSQIRCLEKAIGSGQKKPSFEEVVRVKRIRRGMYDRISGEPTDNPDNAIWLRPEHDVEL